MPAALRRRIPELFATVIAAAVIGWRVDVPSAWRDELATAVAAGRPIPDLFALVRSVDLVHLAYYLIAHDILAVADSVLAVRLFSVAVMAATAGLLVALGRRLGATSVGATSGLLLAASPLASRYGQEARPYALAALAATVAAYALVRATAADSEDSEDSENAENAENAEDSEDGRRCRLPWVGYSVAVGVVGLVNVLGLLVVAGHLTYIAALRRAAWRTWVVATGAALVVLSPFLMATSRQSDQVAWLTRPDVRDLTVVVSGPLGHGRPAEIVVAVALVLGVLLRRTILRPALVLGLGWGLLPPVLLWTLSQVHPLFDERYVVAALPGVCLALGSTAATGLGPTSPRDQGVVGTTAAWPAALLVAALALGGWREQVVYRDPATGHAEDLRGLVTALATQARPGDAVLFVPDHLRIVRFLTPESAASGPDDVALGRDRLTSATLSGVDVDPSELHSRLAGRERVWLISDPRRVAHALRTTPSDRVKLDLLDRGYVEVSHVRTEPFSLTLYQRHPGTG